VIRHFLTYYLHRIKSWFLKIRPDPESMTSEERRDELKWVMDRANAICALEKHPGIYIRIGKEKYAQLVEQDRINNNE